MLSAEKDLNKVLRTNKGNNTGTTPQIDPILYRKLQYNYSTPGYFFGLPEIHKNSLFISIPVDLALTSLKESLQQDQNLTKHTNMPVSNINDETGGWTHD